jgi:serine/threonine-protein kinase
MDEVYRARDTELERDVAVKLLSEAVARNLDRLERFDEAIADLERPGGDAWERLEYRGWVYARAGKNTEARAVLAQLGQLAHETFVDPGCFALVYAGLGESDRAFEWLKRALAERSTELLYLKMRPEWEPIRNDPRFAELIRRTPYYIEE